MSRIMVHFHLYSKLYVHQVILYKLEFKIVRLYANLFSEKCHYSRLDCMVCSMQEWQ